MPVDCVPLLKDNELKCDIIKLIATNYLSDVENMIDGRSRWKRIGDVTETVSKVSTGLTSILAFAAGFFGYTVLSFIAGCFGTISLVLLQFSSYAMNESKEYTNEVNRILSQLGIEEVVDIASDPVNFTNTNNAADSESAAAISKAKKKLISDEIIEMPTQDLLKRSKRGLINEPMQKTDGSSSRKND